MNTSTSQVTMSRSFQADRERFLLELELYVAKADGDTRHHTEPVFDETFEHWRESLLAYLIKLEVCARQGDDERYDESYNRAQECLDKIATLVGG